MAAERLTANVMRGAAWRRKLPGEARSGDGLADIQRSRLVSAALSVVDELGPDGASVLRITAKAGVSRRTFYEIFENGEECLLAAFDRALQQAMSELIAANLDGIAWRDQVRDGLWTILCLFDSEPALARLCVVHSLSAGPEVLARRQQIVKRLIAVVEAGAGEASRSAASADLTAEGVVGAVLAILHQRLCEEEHAPLRSLLGDLMSMIVLPYLGAQAARHERRRAVPEPPHTGGAPADAAPAELLAQLPMRMTYRTARVLHDLAEHPGSSNREIAGRVGVSDQGQISKLLARLLRLELVANAAEKAPSKGEPNKWSLTSTGWQVMRTIGVGGRAGELGARR